MHKEARPNKTITVKILTATARWAAALTFLLTGLLKAAAAASFAQTIVNYGFPRFPFMAPVIIVIEVLVALFLIFRIHEKRTALFGAAMMVGFTLLYSYALVFKGITDCGCFGGLRALNNNTVLFYVKNAVLLALLLFVFFTAENRAPRGPRALWVGALLIVAAALTAFTADFTYDRVHYKKMPRPVAVKDSPLHKFANFAPDSTYVVFAFSYTCPHCMNSVGNLKEYEAFGVADCVIGLALGDSLTRAFFFDATRPNFPIFTHGTELLQLSRSFPRLFYIERDSIRYDLKGEAPAPYILSLLVK